MDIRESFYDAVIDGKSAAAGEIRTLCLDQMHAQLSDRPELWEKLTPTYAPGCKRVIITDDYYPALARDNVSLETRPIDKITASGIEVQADEKENTPTHQDYDLIVCATGFKTLQFMHPIEVYGINGRALSDIWKQGAQAYLGTTVEDLPNFGMLYGPNSKSTCSFLLQGYRPQPCL